jgi:hypothetical protein
LLFGRLRRVVAVLATTFAPVLIQSEPIGL